MRTTREREVNAFVVVSGGECLIFASTENATKTTKAENMFGMLAIFWLEKDNLISAGRHVQNTPIVVVATIIQRNRLAKSSSRFRSPWIKLNMLSVNPDSFIDLIEPRMDEIIPIRLWTA
jgi:hypothetical protein